jgi:ribosomal protein S12 methylthiotransferase accessory factor
MADALMLDGIESLVSPFGVLGSVARFPAPRGLSDASIFVSHYDDWLPALNTRWYGDADQARRPERRKSMRAGAGRKLGDDEEARLVAIAEGAERYSGGQFDEAMKWAAYRELDGAAMDPLRIPRCSAAELATPGCPLRPLDSDAPIRWLRGVDLASGVTTWIPAVMACYALRDVAPQERFWYRISTGFAVHTDPVEALVRGICEVIERDAIAVSWLQKLPLPSIADRDLSGDAIRLLAWSRRHFIDTYLFDATTDMAVPTVFCLQVAPYDQKAARVLSCATRRSIQSAAQRALLEACAGRSYFYTDEEPRENFVDFSSIGDGCRYMARPSSAAAFDFLIEDARDRIAPERQPLPQDSRATLAWLVTALSRKGMQVIAVDRTTRELAVAGLTAVNVVIPDLQPMSLLPLAQYRAHPRLYAAPGLMGYRSLTEEELNPWPVPYA